MSQRIWRHISVFVLFSGLLLQPAYAAIYKTVDKDGNVVFTDVPPKDQGAKVELTAGNSYVAPEPVQAAAAEIEASADEEEAPEYTYQSLRINSPADDAAVRANDGNVTISLDVAPLYDPNSGHIVQLLLDGQVYAQSVTDNAITLVNVDRGTHQVQARIVDDEGQIVIASEPVTFHLLRFSALLGGG